MISFDPTQENDAKTLKEIATQAFNDDKKQYGSPPPGIDTLDWQVANIKSGMYYKIVSDWQIIGGMKLFDMQEGHYRLGSIFILPDFQN